MANSLRWTSAAPEWDAVPLAQPRRPPRYADSRSDSRSDSRLWCLMLTLMILCGSALIMGVVIAALIFFAQNNT
jgi:hypothetical protein